MPTSKFEYYYSVSSVHKVLSELERKQLEEAIKLLEDMWL